MRLENITVEVRDKALKRVGIIPASHLNLQLDVLHNNVGGWTVTLPSEHRIADILRVPGAGVIVRDGKTVIASGPVVTHTFTATPMDPDGSVEFKGVTDDIILADMLAWPTPSSSDPAAQGQGFDARSGVAETVMHGYVNDNIGPGAPSPRRRTQLTMGPNGARGPNTTKAVRFQKLGELLSEIALPANLGFQIVQRGPTKVFETYEIVDRTKTVRLDVRNETLSGQKLAVSAPSVTQVIVAGKVVVEGGDDQRTYAQYSNDAATEAQTDWARRIEHFANQTGTDDPAEWQQTADEQLADGGFTSIAVQVVPMDGETMQFGRDWGLGDRVSVVVDKLEFSSVVTGYSLDISSQNGLVLVAHIGDPSDFNPAEALRKRVLAVDRRLSTLERR